jgi:hypothetical protein
VLNNAWARPGANLIAGPGPMIYPGSAVAVDPRTHLVTGGVGGRGVGAFAGGWAGLSSAAGVIGRRWGGGYSSAYGGRWGWGYSPSSWGGWVGGSENGYGNPYYVPLPIYTESGTGYGNLYYTESGTGYGNPYSDDTEARRGNDSSASAAPQERNNSAPTSAPGKEDAANTGEEIPAAVKRGMDAARLAFQKGDYAVAQGECERAIRLQPGDPNLHEFRALCQFARGKYQDAAATLYPVLAAGPGWDWDTLSSFYPSAATYIRQLRALEQSVREHPKDAAGRFVLAYHYLVLDERDPAFGQLQEVVKLQPKDKVSAGIREALVQAKKGQDEAPADKPAPGR